MHTIYVTKTLDLAAKEHYGTGLHFRPNADQNPYQTDLPPCLQEALCDPAGLCRRAHEAPEGTELRKLASGTGSLYGDRGELEFLWDGTRLLAGYAGEIDLEKLEVELTH